MASGNDGASAPLKQFLNKLPWERDLPRPGARIRLDRPPTEPYSLVDQPVHITERWCRDRAPWLERLEVGDRSTRTDSRLLLAVLNTKHAAIKNLTRVLWVPVHYARPPRPDGRDYATLALTGEPSTFYDVPSKMDEKIVRAAVNLSRLASSTRAARVTSRFRAGCVTKRFMGREIMPPASHRERSVSRERDAASRGRRAGLVCRRPCDNTSRRVVAVTDGSRGISRDTGREL